VLFQKGLEHVEVVPMPGQEGVDAVDAVVELVVDPGDLVPDAPRVGPHAERCCLHQALDRLHVRELVGVGHVVPLDADGGFGAWRTGWGYFGVDGRRDLSVGIDTTVTRFHDFHSLFPCYGFDPASVGRAMLAALVGISWDRGG
jgi:hypothetical protein